MSASDYRSASITVYMKAVRQCGKTGVAHQQHAKQSAEKQKAIPFQTCQ